MTSNYIKAKIALVKKALCQKLADGELTVEELTVVEKEFASKGETDNYYQAEAIKQAIEWWDSIK